MGEVIGKELKSGQPIIIPAGAHCKAKINRKIKPAEEKEVNKQNDKEKEEGEKGGDLKKGKILNDTSREEHNSAILRQLYSTLK